MKQAFTLIELLVVVLIIGILTAVALPQYQKAVERARWVEAIINLRAIAQANQVYYLANGVYAEQHDLDKLDIQLAGTTDAQISPNRIVVKNFIFSPNGGDNQFLALAQWANNSEWDSNEQYFLYIDRADPSRIHCSSNKSSNTIQKQLCGQIEANGSL